MLTPARDLRRRLITYALATAYLLVLVTGMVMVGLDPELTRPEALSAIGLNLIAAVVFGAVFSLISVRAQERAVNENLQERFDELSRTLTELMAAGQQDFLPTTRYEASDDFDPHYNRDVMHSFESTGYYSYKGPSPRYLPARVKAARRHPHMLRVCMLDPNARRAVSRRAADRRSRPTARGKSTEQLAAELREELVMSVIALFDCRDTCPVEIVYGVDGGVSRTELLDDSAYVSWYHGQNSAGHTFPESLRFPKGSLVYEMQKVEINRLHEVTERRAAFNSGHTDADLTAHLEDLLGEPVTADRIARLRAEFARFSSGFVRHLEACAKP